MLKAMKTIELKKVNLVLSTHFKSALMKGYIPKCL